MSEGDRATRVTVLDEAFAIRSEAPVDYTRRVAAHVDATLRGLRQASPTLEPFPTAVLGAMEITNDLFRSRDALGELAGSVAERIEALAATIDEALEREARLTEEDTR